MIALRRGLAAATSSLLLVVATNASAKEWWAAPTTSGTADGSSAHPFDDLQAAVNALAPGDTLYLKGGTYELSRNGVTVPAKASGTAGAPTLITNAPGEAPLIKGSLTLPSTTTWTNDGGAVFKTPWTILSQQVFVDGASLRQIGEKGACNGPAAPTDPTLIRFSIGKSRADMIAGSFWADGTDLYVWLEGGDDPSKHVVEASRTKVLFELEGATYVTLRGLGLQHSNRCEDLAGGGAIQLGSYCRVEACDVEWTDFAGVAMGYEQHDSAVVGSTLRFNGDEGIGASESNDVVISGNLLEKNNTRAFNPDWGSGGMKLVPRCGGSIDHNVARDNVGPGIWLDTDQDADKHWIIRDNFVANNDAGGGGGLMLEVSQNILAHDNVVVGNKPRGIYVSASAHVQIFHNTIVGNVGSGGGSAAIDLAGRPTRWSGGLTFVDVRDNIIAFNTTDDDLHVIKTDQPDVHDLTFDDNLVWRASGKVVMHWTEDARGGWAGTTYDSLAAFAAATKTYCAACVQSDPSFLVGKADDFRLSKGSAAIDVAADVRAIDPSLAADYVGAKRPYGSNSDLGAFEWSPTEPAPDAGGDATISDAPADVSSDARATGEGAAIGDDTNGAGNPDGSSTSQTSSSGGCGCRTASTTSFGGAGWWLLLLVRIAAHRRRRDGGGKESVSTP